MHRAASFLVSVFLTGAFACEEPLSPVIVQPAGESSDSLTIPLGGTVDISDGLRNYRNVHIEGTLTYHTNFFDGLERSGGSTGGGRVGVFLHVAVKFRREDPQGVSQNWHAGGKSYEILDVREDGTAMTSKKYQVWGVEERTFVNMEFLIQRSDVRINCLWISYEYPD